MVVTAILMPVSYVLDAWLLYEKSAVSVAIAWSVGYPFAFLWLGYLVVKSIDLPLRRYARAAFGILACAAAGWAAGYALSLVMPDTVPAFAPSSSAGRRSWSSPVSSRSGRASRRDRSCRDGELGLQRPRFPSVVVERIFQQPAERVVDTPANRRLPLSIYQEPETSLLARLARRAPRPEYVDPADVDQRPVAEEPCEHRGPIGTIAQTTEEALVAILDAPCRAGVGAAQGYAEKETALRRVMTGLSIADRSALHARLVAPGGTDPLVDRFSRLIPERRDRLLAVLIDPRRQHRDATEASRG